MTHEQKPKSAEFRALETQVSECARDLHASLTALEEKLYVEFAEAEAQGAAEQRRKDAASDPDDVTCALMDSQYVAGAKFGWNCGQDDDHASLHKMIEGRLRDRIEAGVSFSERRKEQASTVHEHEHEQRRKDAEGAEEWRPMNTAPKDGTPILVKTVLTPETFGDIRSHWMGRFVVVQHDGVTPSGFDLRWRVACPVGFGGIPDEWLVGWCPVDRHANVAALEARVKELEGERVKAVSRLRSQIVGYRKMQHSRIAKSLARTLHVVYGETYRDSDFEHVAVVEDMLRERAEAAESRIAEAVAAERERCAKVCEKRREAFANSAYAASPRGAFSEMFACERCAAAIREGGEG